MLLQQHEGLNVIWGSVSYTHKTNVCFFLLVSEHSNELRFCAMKKCVVQILCQLINFKVVIMLQKRSTGI